jgi:hypothetical protein
LALQNTPDWVDSMLITPSVTLPVARLVFSKYAAAVGRDCVGLSVSDRRRKNVLNGSATVQHQRSYRHRNRRDIQAVHGKSLTGKTARSLPFSLEDATIPRRPRK